MKSTVLIESLINAQEAPAVIIDKNFNIIAANNAYCTSYGVDKKSIVGQQCHKISHHLSEPCFLHGEDCPHQTVLATNKPFEVMHIHYDHANQPDRVRIKSYPVETANGDLFVLETIHRLAPDVSLTCEEMRMVGRSPVFLQFVENITAAARSSVPVLLYGETGTGKELGAKFLHEQSERKEKPYVELNCAAIPESLFESELFGHERGAFTGCAGMKKGLFELADEGTLFLDEIGELPLSMQSKLLRVLDSGEFRRVGGTTLIKVDVRIVAATNRNLMAMVAEGRFREDLYFRIAGIRLSIPPLRERRADIPALADALIARMSKKDKAGKCHITRDAVTRLVNHDFPGNIRELLNIIQKAVALSVDGIITAEHIHLNEHEHRHAHQHPHTTAPLQGRAAATGAATPRSIAEAESHHISELLHRHKHDKRIVAKVLGISERTLYRKIKKHQIIPQNPT